MILFSIIHIIKFLFKCILTNNDIIYNSITALLLSVAIRDELCKEDSQDLTQGTVLVSYEVVLLK